MSVTYDLPAGNQYLITYRIYRDGVVNVNVKFTQTDREAEKTEVLEDTNLATFTPGKKVKKKEPKAETKAQAKNETIESEKAKEEPSVESKPAQKKHTKKMSRRDRKKQKAKTTKGKPTAIVAITTKGKGVSFMENQASWHGKAPNEEQYKQAMEELQ